MHRSFARILLGASLVAAPLAGPALASPAHCPPGLAKKAVPCVPPGQAKKQGDHHHLSRGDHVTRDAQILLDPGRYGLRDDRTYVVVRDQVYRVDPDTRAVLDIIGALAELAD
ncbi:DUF1236 domain-containing protein [Mameliella alba]|nr:DUF1236 domain-containing protein [Mameliella alba]MBY6170005.1 DUF1236 domain-containing protein [Mameliella alba]MBY6175018.1 DUF1236 domain-containing protein [Mameliella alba]